MFAKRRRKKWPIVLAMLLAFFLMIAGVAAYVATTLTLEFDRQVEAEYTVEYGTEFEAPVFCATVSSSLFPQLKYEVSVVCNGEIHTEKVGAYARAYTASFLWLDISQLMAVRVVDTQPPVISLNGTGIADGCTAYDDYDGDLTDKVTWSITENVLTYQVSDSSGNHAFCQRIIESHELIPPVLTLAGEKKETLLLGREYVEAGFSAVDAMGKDITHKVSVAGAVDIHTKGEYTITYNVTDVFGSTATAERIITVQAYPQPEIVAPQGKVICLTFDDGPSSHTQRLLEILDKYDVKATFFVVDNDFSYLLEEIVERGHSIGVHSASHIYDEIYASEEAFFADFKQVHQLIADKTGVSTTLMRFPGGSSNSVSKFNPGIMTRLTAIATDYGLQYFDWNVNAQDAGDARTADEVYYNVICGVENRSFSIVLQHDIYDFSVDAVERIIVWGLENGYTFMPLQPNSPTCHQQVQN